MPLPRINESIVRELEALHNAMAEDNRNDASYYAEEFSHIIDMIRGKGGRLWRTDTWIRAVEENPLKDIPDVTLVEAAIDCWAIAMEKPPRKQWFSGLDMDKALRQVIADESVLPRFIDGRHWGKRLQQMAKDGYLERVELVGSRGGPGGIAYKLSKNLIDAHFKAAAS